MPIISKLTLFVLTSLFALTIARSSIAQDPERVEPFAPKGVLLLVGGGKIGDNIRSIFPSLVRNEELKERSKLVIIPTASSLADEKEESYWKEPWQKSDFKEIAVLHTRDREEANSDAFLAKLADASAVWFSGGSQSRIAEAYQGTKTEETIIKMLAEGAAVGGTSAGAAIASRVMIAGGKQEPEINAGMNLLPGAIVDQHFTERNRLGRLKAAVAKHPTRVGIGIDESTGVLIYGRSLQVVGAGSVSFVYAATDRDPLEVQNVRANVRDLDWTSIVRKQQERLKPEFPQPKSQTPSIDAGSLMIVGGGGMPKELWEKFFELAGGKEAKVAVFPTAVPNPTTRSYEASILRRLGAAQVTVLNATDPETVRSKEFAKQIEESTGIWFSGGRQWRFVDLYEDTPAYAAMHKVLKRGGIIGGSSAGASIQGDLLIRGAPVGNWIMVQDGYRRGFGFLPGVGIDQHFSQRNRFEDLEAAIKEFPSMLGIGIDESTALLVTKDQAEVLGKGSVYIYNAKSIAARQELPAKERPVRFETGSSFKFTDILD